MLNENSFIEEEGTLISFVNHHFGPLRGLNFIVKGNPKKVIEDYLEKQPNETIDEIWGETLISSRAMALPMQLSWYRSGWGSITCYYTYRIEGHGTLYN